MLRLGTGNLEAAGRAAVSEGLPACLLSLKFTHLEIVSSTHSPFCWVFFFFFLEEKFLKVISAYNRLNSVFKIRVLYAYPLK